MWDMYLGEPWLGYASSCISYAEWLMNLKFYLFLYLQPPPKLPNGVFGSEFQDFVNKWWVFSLYFLCGSVAEGHIWLSPALSIRHLAITVPAPRQGRCEDCNQHNPPWLLIAQSSSHRQHNRSPKAQGDSPPQHCISAAVCSSEQPFPSLREWPRGQRAPAGLRLSPLQCLCTGCRILQAPDVFSHPGTNTFLPGAIPPSLHLPSCTSVMPALNQS